MKKRTVDRYVDTEDLLHKAMAELTVDQKMQLLDLDLSNKTSSPSQPQAEQSDPWETDPIGIADQQSMADQVAAWRRRTYGAPSTSPALASPEISGPSNPQSEIMQASLSKSLELAEKQRRLLQTLSNSSCSEPKRGSTP